jgi:hypothetical protein
MSIKKITILLFFALCCFGCGNQSRLSGLVPVEGVVLYKGQPLADATVSFDPGNPELRSAVGITDAEGKFVMMTLNPKDGAAPGKYKVAIAKYDDKNKSLTLLIPRKYTIPTQSGLTATVPAKGVKDLKFELE